MVSRGHIKIRLTQNVPKYARLTKGIVIESVATIPTSCG